MLKTPQKILKLTTPTHKLVRYRLALSTRQAYSSPMAQGLTLLLPTSVSMTALGRTEAGIQWRSYNRRKPARAPATRTAPPDDQQVLVRRGIPTTPPPEIYQTNRIAPTPNRQHRQDNDQNHDDTHRAQGDQPDDNTLPVERDIPATRRRQHRTRAPIKRKTAATLTITSWNMHSHGTGPNDKWLHINQVMKDRRIGVLCLQETHLTPKRVTTIEELFGKRLHLLYSQPPDRAGSAQGVAIVLNRDITNTCGIKRHIIIPGRAILVTIPWHQTQTVTHQENK